jgi:hypothetical protein
LKATGMNETMNINCRSLERTDERKINRFGFSHIKTKPRRTK